MRRLAIVALLVSSGASARTVIRHDDQGASADVVSVRGKLTGNIATLRIGLSMMIDEPGYATVIDNIPIPSTAVVTGATVRRNGVAHRLELVTAESATKRWGELGLSETEADQVAPGSRRNAVLVEGGSGQVTVSIATPRSGRLDLELELSMQTCFHRDARYVVLPTEWALHVRGLRTIAKPSEDVMASCSLAEEGTVVAFPAPEVAKRPSGDRIGAFAARLDAGGDHFVRVELDLAAELTEVPTDLATVLVVDGSRSMSAEDRDAQRELVVSYLRNAKASRVQVIAYARTARPLLPGWTAASTAANRVDRELRALAPRNGSNLDAGLAEAGAWLERIEGTRRVVVVSDELLPLRLQDQAPVTLKRALPAGTLVHVVATNGSPGIFREDGSLLSTLAAATDGISVRVGKGGANDKAIDATMLVRPITIDQLEVTSPGWTQFHPTSEIPACGITGEVDIAEGDACSWWGHGDAHSGPIAIAGLMWGQRVTRVLRPDPSHGLEVARELSVSATSFEPALKDRIDKLARAINPQWSMYAEWGGTGGYFEGVGLGISGMSSCCHTGGSFSSSPSIGIGTMGRGIPPEDLSAQLAPAVAACKLGEAKAHADIEMTELEVVGVTVGVDGDVTNPHELRRLQSCIEDAIWDSSPMLARPLSHSTHKASFGA